MLTRKLPGGPKGGVSWHTSRARSRGPWMAIPSPRPAPGWRLRRRSPGVVWQCGGSERRRFALKSRSATKLDLAGTYRLTAGPAAGEAKIWMHRAGARPAAIQGGGKGEQLTLLSRLHVCYHYVFYVYYHVYFMYI